MSNISNLFNLYSTWNNAPLHLAQYADEQFRNTWVYYNTSSPTLNSTLHYTVGGHGNQEKSYKILSGICTLLNDKPIQFLAHYKTISSMEAETLSMDDIYNRIRRTNGNIPANTIKIHIFLTPRGKTYLKNLLDTIDQSNRLKAIETFAIEDATHFIRIYKDFLEDNTNTYVVFTDRINEHIMNTLIVMFPNLFDIVPLDIPEDLEDLEEKTRIEKHNARVIKAREIFELLYKVYTNVIPYDSAETLTTLILLLTEFSNLYPWNSTLLKDFTTRLAHIKNENKLEQINKDIKEMRANIEAYESNLERYYNLLARYNRDLIAYQALKPDDISEFTETIENTKAIEIISSSKSMLKIRVTAPLQYFTPSDFETYERNPGSTLNTMYAKGTVAREILHKIFVTREYKLMLQAVVNLEIRSNSGNPLNIYVQTSSNSYYNTLPNPHLYYFNCWSQALSNIHRNIANNEFHLALMQIVAAVQSVNVAESASFINKLLPAFKNDSWTSLIKIINDKDEVLSWTEIQKYELELEQVENENNTDNTKRPYTQIVISETDADDDDFDEEDFDEGDE